MNMDRICGKCRFFKQRLSSSICTYLCEEIKAGCCACSRFQEPCFFDDIIQNSQTLASKMVFVDARRDDIVYRSALVPRTFFSSEEEAIAVTIKKLDTELKK